jgi:hypothetical protein
VPNRVDDSGHNLVLPSRRVFALRSMQVVPNGVHPC